MIQEIIFIFVLVYTIIVLIRMLILFNNIMKELDRFERDKDLIRTREELDNFYEKFDDYVLHCKDDTFKKVFLFKKL